MTISPSDHLKASIPLPEPPDSKLEKKIRIAELYAELKANLRCMKLFSNQSRVNAFQIFGSKCLDLKILLESRGEEEIDLEELV